VSLQVIADAAVFAAWIAVQVLLETSTHLRRQLDPATTIKPVEQRHFIAVEVVEADVDAALGRYQLAVAHAGTE
jgi:hypothetical protein